MSGEVGSPRRSSGRGNCDQNILYEKKLFSIKHVEKINLRDSISNFVGEKAKL